MELADVKDVIRLNDDLTVELEGTVVKLSDEAYYMIKTMADKKSITVEEQFNKMISDEILKDFDRLFEKM